MADEEVWYVAYCPDTGVKRCKYATKRLGAFESDAAARKEIARHLERSSIHWMKPEDAEKMAAEATTVEREVYSKSEKRERKACSNAAADVNIDIEQGFWCSTK